ncbi:swi5-dependent recombination DNA repair protein 1 homolog isoform X1 [Larimichthys crocea]|uniref:swi5-dependent recombination DNA repair protein 1 homolog isoform X1 n=1 Tax=Larimichthys crocea TaxID=215358 RepID=UPI000900BA74|nr:swi5-dependent recombination DNA repair protein 1 homolog isoform X1 [Larimichthys crocea]
MEITPKSAKLKSVHLSPRTSESSPGENKEGKQHQKLSASLKERLKRSRRSFTSPCSVAKRLCVDEEEEDGRQVSADSQETVHNSPLIIPNVDVNRNEGRSGSERSAEPSKDLSQQREQLRKEVKDKTETLRRLKMVQMYRSKNNLTQLQNLIDKWRSCAQAALYELQSEVPIDGRKASLSGLIDLFGLDDGILHFDHTEDDFTA